MLEIRGGRTTYSEEVQIGEVCGEVQISCKTYSGNFENKLCLSCKELPLCMGNCGRDYKPEEGNKTETICVNNLDLSYEEIILNYCKMNEPQNSTE